MQAEIISIDVEILDKLNKAYVDSVLKSDVRWFDEHLSEDFLNSNPDGTILDRAWVNQDMTQFQTGVQTVGVPAGGGAVFDVKIDEPGLYPFVSHSFASVDMGQVGLLKVGNPKGSGGH